MDDYTQRNLRKWKNLDLCQLIGMGRDAFTKIKHHNTDGNMKQIAFYLPLKNLIRVSSQHGLHLDHFKFFQFP